MQEESQYISFSVLQEAIRQARYNALKGFDKRNIYRMVEFSPFRHVETRAGAVAVVAVVCVSRTTRARQSSHWPLLNIKTIPIF